MSSKGPVAPTCSTGERLLDKAQWHDRCNAHAALAARDTLVFASKRASEGSRLAAQGIVGAGRLAPPMRRQRTTLRAAGLRRQADIAGSAKTGNIRTNGSVALYYCSCAASASVMASASWHPESRGEGVDLGTDAIECFCMDT